MAMDQKMYFRQLSQKIRAKKITPYKKNNLLNLKLLYTHSMIYARSKIKFKKHLDNINFQQKAILILDQQNDYIDKIDNKDYNRFCDPIFDLINGNIYRQQEKTLCG